MRNQRVNEESSERRHGSVAVAIDKDRFSQYALKWASENILRRNQTVKLIHVIHRSLQSNHNNSVENGEEVMEQNPDMQTMEVFLPFRCFCTRRHLLCEMVVLQQQDVARALIEYVTQHGIETLLLGAPSKKSLSRIFKATDTPGTVLKWAPDFCNVYIVSKGKCHAARAANRPVPSLLSPISQPDPSNMTGESVAVSYDEFSSAPQETGDSFVNSGRPSTDSTFFSFYENLGLNLNKDSESARSSVNLSSLSELPSNSFDSGTTPYSLQNMEEMDDEIKRLKMELKQTVEMYHAAYKESLAAKQKAIQLEHWKMKEEKRLQEAKLVEEKEKARYKAAMEASEAAQKILKLEMQKRVNAEMRAGKEAEEKTKVLDALGKFQMVLKYQCLFHVFVVLFLLYFYFCLLKKKN